MADHYYKPWEAPKGQRWEYFLEYYKKPAIVTILVIAALISILYTAVFAPKPDSIILAAHYVPVEPTFWEDVAAAMGEMPFDYNEDGESLIEFNAILFDERLQNGDPEAHLAAQTRLSASIAATESALQIVDADTLPYFEEQGLLGTYGELPDTRGHGAHEPIQIPLSELTPFKEMKHLPEGLFMTLRPRELMHIGDNKAKAKDYEDQIQILLTMMEE